MSNKKISIWLPLLISLSMIAGMFIGFKMRDSFPGQAFFSARQSNTLNELLRLIGDKYVDDVDMGRLKDTAIEAILAKLDPHSAYIPPAELEDINDEINGQFYGIGIEYELINDTLEVISLLKEGTAAKAGLLKGDRLIRVDGKNIAGINMPSDSIRKLIRGSRGSGLTLNILRKKQTLNIKLNREMIPISSVNVAYMLDASTGFIRIDKFTTNTHREFMLALTDLQKKGMKKLILDLRDNGGGVLDEAVEIADEFLSGDKLITYTEGKHSPKKEYRCKRPGEFETGSLTVLCNENSASASEILMGALQDWDRATIIGRRSFGKGLVQEQYDLSDQGAVRLTIARYYTPTGRCIQRSYQNGLRAYYEDAYLSPKIQDSLDAKAPVFTSPAGKKLFGGGGIKPDIMISDSTERSFDYFTKELDQNSIDRFAHQLILSDTGFMRRFESPGKFFEDYQFTEDTWNQFLHYCFKDIPNPPAYNEALKQYITGKIMETMAYQIWRDEGFYEIDNHLSPFLQEAIRKN